MDYQIEVTRQYLRDLKLARKRNFDEICRHAVCASAVGMAHVFRQDNNVKLSIMTNEQRWMERYELLKASVAAHHQMPDKKKVENRGLLNWWKYNKKRVRQGLLDPDKVNMLMELSRMRDVFVWNETDK